MEGQLELECKSLFHLAIGRLPLARWTGPIAILVLFVFWPRALKFFPVGEEGVVPLSRDWRWGSWSMLLSFTVISFLECFSQTPDNLVGWPWVAALEIPRANAFLHSSFPCSWDSAHRSFGLFSIGLVPVPRGCVCFTGRTWWCPAPDLGSDFLPTPFHRHGL